MKKIFKITFISMLSVMVCVFGLSACNIEFVEDDSQTAIEDTQTTTVETDFESYTEDFDDFEETQTITTIEETQATTTTEETQATTTTIEETQATTETQAYVKSYTFRNAKLFGEHYEKHGIEMGFNSPDEYLQGANDVINNPNSLHKLEQEDNDEVYYLESTGEFVVVSTDGYIRTYFYASLDYYNRQ
jgi:pyocin large subunit-like protein